MYIINICDQYMSWKYLNNSFFLECLNQNWMKKTLNVTLVCQIFIICQFNIYKTEKKRKNQETVVILRCSTKIWYSYCDIYLDCRAFIYLFFCVITWICYCLKSSLQSNLICDNINYLIDPVHQCYSLMYHILKEYHWCNCLFFIE